ncbi:MAG: exodeoxyribonuclease VII large subunit [Gallionella sp.]|nr:exodeoxyribonuclease VII large subunit [Gallionella sp.]
MYVDLFFEKMPRVLRVTELTRAINELLEGNVPPLWVRGEISGLVKAASGHWYFVLKDEQAQVRCVMFRHKNPSPDKNIANGTQVEVLAVATLYEARGDFQLNVEQLRPAGLGVLYEQFAKLKQKLEDEGLFAAAHKRALPAFPRRIGIITSVHAAALRDVLTTLKRRLPGVPVVLYPAPVQGAGSAEKIASAIRIAGQRGECDVLILCRGGGSIEDLWAFNEEVVARAIYDSPVPIVSGVGHETDFTIADFVADERAPTPTAAAQRVVPDRHALMQGLRDIARHLLRAQRNRVQNAMQSVDYLQRRLIHPSRQLANHSQHLDQLRQRLMRSYAMRLQQQQYLCQSYARRLSGSDFHRLRDKQDHLAGRLCMAMQNEQNRQQANMDALAQHLALLDPKQVLRRGYSLVQDESGRLVSGIRQLTAGDELRITLAEGWVRTKVMQLGE